MSNIYHESEVYGIKIYWCESPKTSSYSEKFENWKLWITSKEFKDSLAKLEELAIRQKNEYYQSKETKSSQSEVQSKPIVQKEQIPIQSPKPVEDINKDIKGLGISIKVLIDHGYIHSNAKVLLLYTHENKKITQEGTVNQDGMIQIQEGEKIKLFSSPSEWVVHSNGGIWIPRSGWKAVKLLQDNKRTNLINIKRKFMEDNQIKEKERKRPRNEQIQPVSTQIIQL